MVNGSFAASFNGVYTGGHNAAAGVWAPMHQGVLNSQYTWQAGFGNGWTPWTEHAKTPVPCLAIPERDAPQLDVDSPPRSPGGASSVASSAASAASPASEPGARRGPTAGRAAKRLRCRERRRLFKATAQERAAAAAAAQRFEAHVAAVAASSRLVVKKTFFEVDSEDSEGSDGYEVELPPALFSSTPEVEEWRREYRRFRLGHHHGAKGEVTSLRIGVSALGVMLAQ